MSVILTGTLGLEQPSQSQITWVPLGGDGKASPFGCYVVRLEIVGDGSTGTATLSLRGDERYTNVAAWVAFEVEAAAAAPDFRLRMFNDDTATQPVVNVVGTAPQISSAIATVNAAFLWYPPAMFYAREGIWEVVCLNIGAGETYRLAAEVYMFDADIRQITPLPYLMMNFPGVSAPAAI